MSLVQLDLFAALKPDKAARPKKATPRRKRRAKRAVSTEAPVEYTSGVDEDGRAWWRLRFPAPDRMLSGNNPVYWRTRHGLTTSWREAMFVHATAAKLPKGLDRVRLAFELRFPSARTDRDALNYNSLVVKPASDGLGPEFRQAIKRGVRAGQVSFQPGYGLFADDTPAHVDGPYITLGPKCADPKRTPFGEVVVTIVDLSGEAA